MCRYGVRLEPVHSAQGCLHAIAEGGVFLPPSESPKEKEGGAGLVPSGAGILYRVRFDESGDLHAYARTVGRQDHFVAEEARMGPQAPGRRPNNIIFYIEV
jgi:hypothetical protein